MCFWLVSSSFYDQKICDGWSLAAMFNEVTSNKIKNNNKKTCALLLPLLLTTGFSTEKKMHNLKVKNYVLFSGHTED